MGNLPKHDHDTSAIARDGPIDGSQMHGKTKGRTQIGPARRKGSEGSLHQRGSIQ